MDTQNFLESALPSSGLYCAVGIKNGATKHTFADGIDKLIEAAKQYDESGHDTYFACHTFLKNRRLQEYAKEARSFYLDLDCGEAKAAEGKGYATKKDALHALKDFCKKLGLPRPYVVDSGRGLHVYWILEEPIARDVWTPIARAFKRASLSLGLVIDPAVPADSARILRVPGTHNYKDKENPLPVQVLSRGSTISFADMERAVEGYKYNAALTVKRELDPVTKSLMGNYESNFAKIVRKSQKGTGCAQMAYAIKNAATLEEPLWHAALSIAIRCNDGEKAIHKLSKAYPKYDPEETEKKAQGSGGPRTCAWYKIESGNGKECKDCKHKITSPIQLGRVVLEKGKDEEEEQVDTPTELPVKPTKPARKTHASLPKIGDIIDLDVTDEGTYSPHEKVYAPPPDMPVPYFRGKEGGIYRRDRDSDGEVTEVLISEDDLFVVNRIDDPVDGSCAVLRLHAPHDPVCEFAVPLRELQTPEKFRDVMSNKGVVANKKGMENLMNYTTAYVKQLRSQIKADQARTQFGWADGDTKFILGTREITATKINNSPPSSITRDLAPFLDPKGDLDVWRKAFNMYADVDGAEAHIFALLSSFGSPLIKFTGIEGLLLSLVHTASGTGKTSILHLINSVWGNPKELILLDKDTINAQIHRMGLMNHLPTTWDEMTNKKANELSDGVYSGSQGRGKNRMLANANQERHNTTRWKNISVYSGNASIVDKLGAFKATSEGEQMRVMEFKVPLIVVPGAMDLLESINTNYGWAGTIYAQGLVKQHRNIHKIVEKMRNNVMEAIDAQAKERHWFHGVSSILSGAILAQKMGLHDYDMDKQFDWIVKDIRRRRDMVQSHISASSDMLGEYLNENFGSILMVNTTKINPITGTQAIRQPNNRIAARYEKDTGLIFVPKKEFKDFCVKRQGDLSDALYAPSADYDYLGAGKKRMSSGTGMLSPAVHAFEFKVKGDLKDTLSEDRED